MNEKRDNDSNMLTELQQIDNSNDIKSFQEAIEDSKEICQHTTH